MSRASLPRTLLVCVLIASACSSPTTGGSGRLEQSVELPPLTSLSPGQFRTLQQDLTVNVVFVGYEQGTGPRDIDQAAFLAQLPQTSCAHVRLPWFYGVEQAVGLCFTYDYNVVYSSPAFEDAFFGYLTSISQAAGRTIYQDGYNQQAVRSLDVGSNHRIDGPSVEAWLASHDADAGVDTGNYTIYFVNWYGRSDFQFHVYTMSGEPDPDTGVNLGLTDDRAMIAWGGTPGAHRVWFHDLSAGPEFNSNNWNLADADVELSPDPDYRLPPVWEYGNTAGYRPFVDLSGDLGKVSRFVAINQLFTTSPLYDPAINAPALPTAIDVDISLFLQDAATPPTSVIKPSIVGAAVQDLQPSNEITVDLDAYPLEGQVLTIYRCFLSGYIGTPDPCFGDHKAYLELYHYFFKSHHNTYLEGDGDYEVPVYYFYSSEVNAVQLGGRLQGIEFADSDYDSSQSYVALFTSPETRAQNHGGTKGVIHEVGHHLGMSHTHDGYDYETGMDHSAYDLYYAWTGDESHSPMSYLDVVHTFGQFDRDNMNRYLTVTYINNANVVLAMIAASPRADEIASQIQVADAAAEDALAAYDAMDYATAAAAAKAAHVGLVAAAESISVHVTPN